MASEPENGPALWRVEQDFTRHYHQNASQTLRELEDDNLIIRKMYHEVPPKVEYSLSDTGWELIPFIDHLHNWGKKQLEREELTS